MPLPRALLGVKMVKTAADNRCSPKIFTRSRSWRLPVLRRQHGCLQCEYACLRSPWFGRGLSKLAVRAVSVSQSPCLRLRASLMRSKLRPRLVCSRSDPQRLQEQAGRKRPQHSLQMVFSMKWQAPALTSKSGPVVVDQIRAVDRDRLMKRLGVLADDTLREVLSVLQAMFAV